MKLLNIMYIKLLRAATTNGVEIKGKKSLAVGKRRTTRQRMLNDLFTHEEEHRSKVWHQMLHGKPITYSIHVDPGLVE